MKILQKTELEKLTTPRLLAYLRAWLSVPETQDYDDEDAARMTKDNPIWSQQHRLIKSILSTREHVD